VLDLFGYISYALIGLGMWLLGRNNPLGFLSHALGAAMWAVAGYFLELSSMVIWNILFCLIGINGYYNLKRKVPDAS